MNLKLKYIQYNLRESISQLGEIELKKDEFIINIYFKRNSIDKITVLIKRFKDKT